VLASPGVMDRYCQLERDSGTCQERTMRRLRKAVSILAGFVAVIAIVVYFIFQLPEFGGRFEDKRLERMRRFS